MRKLKKKIYLDIKMMTNQITTSLKNGGILLRSQKNIENKFKNYQNSKFTTATVDCISSMIFNYYIFLKN